MLKESIERISNFAPKLVLKVTGIDSFRNVWNGALTYGDDKLTAALVASIYGSFSFVVPYSGRMAARELMDILKPNFPNNDKRPLVQKLLGAGRHIPGMLLDQASIWLPIIVGMGTGSWGNALVLKIVTNAAVCTAIDLHNPIRNILGRRFDSKALIP